MSEWTATELQTPEGQTIFLATSPDGHYFGPPCASKEQAEGLGASLENQEELKAHLDKVRDAVEQWEEENPVPDPDRPRMRG